VVTAGYPRKPLTRMGTNRSTQLDAQTAGAGLAPPALKVTANDTTVGITPWWPGPRRVFARLRNLLRHNRFDEPALATIIGHFEIVRLMRHPHLKPILRKDPYAPFRPFRTYLSPTFSRAQRRALLREHYFHLTNCLHESFFSQIVLGAPMLWEHAVGRDRVGITISLSECQFEGDLLLEFQLNSQALFHIGMTIAPGQLVDSPAVRAILIARVQGVRGTWGEIRRATKVCSDVWPPFLLMSAVQAIARATDITCIAGVRNSQKQWLPGEKSPDVLFDYDQFWEQLSASAGSRFYLMPVPMLGRPLEQVSVNHRKRTLLRRQFKQSVEDLVHDRFIAAFCAPRLTVKK